jgi:acyl dehydratase
MKIRVHDPVPPLRIRVDPERMKTMALILRDPNPIHWDTAAVRAAGLGDRPVNQGALNVAYVVNALIAWVGDPAAIHTLQLRFLGNVFGGDEVTAGGLVTAVKEVEGETVAEIDVWLNDATEAQLARGVATVKFPSAPGSNSDASG